VPTTALTRCRSKGLLRKRLSNGETEKIFNQTTPLNILKHISKNATFIVSPTKHYAHHPPNMEAKSSSSDFQPFVFGDVVLGASFLSVIPIGGRFEFQFPLFGRFGLRRFSYFSSRRFQKVLGKVSYRI